MNASTILHRPQVTPAEALAYYDNLEPVDEAFLRGKWEGSGLHTDHPMDGLLERFNWYGKEFIDSEQVHPLLFRGLGQRIHRVDPIRTAMRFSIYLPTAVQLGVKYLFLGLPFLFTTRASKARLRQIRYRTKLSTGMVYDDLPIIDHFRKIDEDTVLGAMDYKRLAEYPPFFFVLRRVKNSRH
ncbi:MAG: DUF4334 domain-containing protein [Bacteroidetes bacterium]|nr:MAG: DUF4334 domain-containing protein [Bacteroidota bacterium]